MRSGLLVAFGLALWVFSMIMNNHLFVHSLQLRWCATLLTMIASVNWVTKKENRNTLLRMFKVRGFRALVNSLKDGSYFTFMMAMFVIVILFIQFLHYSVTTTEAFKRLETSITSDEVLVEELGNIEHVALGNSFSYSTKNDTRDLRTSVVVFGEHSTKTIHANSSRYNGNWKVKY